METVPLGSKVSLSRNDLSADRVYVLTKHIGQCHNWIVNVVR